MSFETLAVPVSICAAVAAACWVLSLLTREYSWVDRLWSILPVVYVGWFAWAAGAHDARLTLMAVLVATWGTRLTFNFARKGGYAPGGEDYRWTELRRRISPPLFQVFNFVFVCAIQNALLLAIALPAWVARQHAGQPLGALDAAAAVLVTLFIAGAPTNVTASCCNGTLTFAALGLMTAANVGEAFTARESGSA